MKILHKIEHTLEQIQEQNYMVEAATAPGTQD